MFVIASLHRYTLVDVVVCITGKTPQNAKHAIDEVVNNRDDMCPGITHVHLGCAGGLAKG